MPTFRQAEIVRFRPISDGRFRPMLSTAPRSPQLTSSTVPNAVQLTSSAAPAGRGGAASVAGAASTDAWIFASPTGGFRTPGAVSQLFRDLRERCGVDCRLHDLRHFHATTALSSGVDVRTVAGRLGHASPSMVLNVYSAFIPSADEKAAAVFDRLLA